MTLNLRSLSLRLAFEDGGQDLVEYALLTGIVGIAGAVALGLLRGTMAGIYNGWTNPEVAGSVQNIWIPPPPD